MKNFQSYTDETDLWFDAHQQSSEWGIEMSGEADGTCHKPILGIARVAAKETIDIDAPILVTELQEDEAAEAA